MRSSVQRLDNLWVILGPDYAGKSSVMDLLSTSWNGRFVSYDDRLLSPQHSMVGRLRKSFLSEVLPGIGSVYSADFAISLFNCYAIFLRDQIAASESDRPIIIDSYYYKVLAKCVLAGFSCDRVFSVWRSFPQPKHVVYLDVDTDLAWFRSGEGRELNRLEYFGSEPSRSGFVRFQDELGKLMIKEIAGANVSELKSVGSIEDLAQDVARIIFLGEPDRSNSLSASCGRPYCQGERNGIR
jgi:thymidylate kinase